MRSSLIFKLMGAFILVVGIGALVIFWAVSQSTQRAFNTYTTRGSQAWAAALAPTLVDYYALHQGWQGVDELLHSAQIPAWLNGVGGNGPGGGRGMMGRGMHEMMGQRLILADAAGRVISDTQDVLTGTQLSASDLASGTPIQVDGSLVGTLLVSTPYMLGKGSPAGDFIQSVNRSLVIAVAAATLLALTLGAILFFQITAPLRKLNRAAAAIAQGDLTQRVDIHSKDELGDLGQTFNHMAENLSAMETQRQHMLADVSHELRTPIAVIQANLEGMLDGILPFNAEQLAALHSETLLLSRLVGDLRLLSLAEAGQLDLKRVQTDLGGLIGGVVERVKPQAAGKDVTLQAELQSDLPEVWVDPDRLTQVLNNLIGNALRYTPPGAAITLEARRAAQDVEVSVTDPGPGIAAEDLPYIFDRFYRVDKSRSRASGGSGLGLAIVKQLIEAHGGSVAAQSPVFTDSAGQGYGTCFLLMLPEGPPAA